MIPIQDTGLMLHPWPPNVLVRPNLQWDEGADSPEVWGVGVVTGCGGSEELYFSLAIDSL